MTWQVVPFSALSTAQLYDIMALRQEIFVVEQNCPYLDADGKDHESFHAMAYEGPVLVAYARIVKPGISYSETSIGRVVVKEMQRGQQLGYELMRRCHHFVVQHLGQQVIRISAQTYLLRFYNKLGYQSTGKEYLEDGIPHTEMLVNLTAESTEKL
ncbi:GNAT family N-acetyltransferase [bacterium]|nr:GNAT family N-acetyltransferase [bacterium]